jgi:hypothetical protein
MGGLGTFALGVTAALVARVAAPAIGRWARPLVRGAVKQGLVLSQGAQLRAAGMREDLEDLVAEAREDLRQDAQTAQSARAAQASSRTNGADTTSSSAAA